MSLCTPLGSALWKGPAGSEIDTESCPYSGWTIPQADALNGIATYYALRVASMHALGTNFRTLTAGSAPRGP